MKSTDYTDEGYFVFGLMCGITVGLTVGFLVGWLIF